MSKQLTPMQDLLADLKETKIKSNLELDEIKNEYLRHCSKEVLNKTLDAVILRIETELLPKEEQVIEDAYDDGFENYRDASIGSDDDIIESQDYYNNKFKND